MTFSRHATVDYTGTIMEGKGMATAGTKAFSVPVSFPRRIGEPEGVTSPEELVAAAHATCYAMVVTGALGRATGDEVDEAVRDVHDHGEQGRRGHPAEDVEARGDGGRPAGHGRRGVRRDGQESGRKLPDLDHPAAVAGD